MCIVITKQNLRNVLNIYISLNFNRISFIKEHAFINLPELKRM